MVLYNSNWQSSTKPTDALSEVAETLMDRVRELDPFPDLFQVVGALGLAQGLWAQMVTWLCDLTLLTDLLGVQSEVAGGQPQQHGVCGAECRIQQIQALETILGFGRKKQLTVAEDLPEDLPVGLGAQLHQALPHGRGVVELAARGPGGGAAPAPPGGGHGVGDAWDHGIPLTLHI